MTPSTATRPGAAIFERPESRIDGREKVSGAMRYAADVQRPGMLWAAYATSPHPFATIVRIDTSAARALPGVHAVITAADIGPDRRFGRMLFDQPVLAYDRVLFIGDRVAAIAAESREIAEEAARLVEVVYDEQTPLLDPFAALAPGAPVLHPERARYFYAGAPLGFPTPAPAQPNVQGELLVEKGEGDLGAAFARADAVFEHRFAIPRAIAAPIEPHATVVWIDDDGLVHVYSVHKQPFFLRRFLAHVTGLPPERIVVESNAIGGDFGGKGYTTDEYVCYYLARATGRPVKRVATYVDELQSMSTRHETFVRLRTGVARDGTFLVHDSEVVYTGGAYAAGKPGPLLLPGAGYSTVPYDVPRTRVSAKTVYTNTLPGAHVRAPSDVQIFFAWERHVDRIAAALGCDPLDLRARNVVRGARPTIRNEVIYEPVGDAVIEVLRRETQREPLAPGEAWGTALVCRHSGGHMATGVRMRATGDGVELILGVPDQGSGARTAMQRIASAALGVPPERIDVRSGSTADAAFDPGSGGSWVTHVVGLAVEDAAAALVCEVERRAGERFSPDVLARVAAAEPIAVSGEFRPHAQGAGEPADFGFAGVALRVRVDAETGAYRIIDAVLVAETGTILNPVAHLGQLEGGFVFGLGAASLEEIPLDESGKVTVAGLGDYKLPTVRDVPPLRIVHVPGATIDGPFGSKSVGELGNIGVAPALANAVDRACGASLTTLPVTAERIFAALAVSSPAARPSAG